MRPPGSKSLTNRALLCAALARGPSRLSGLLTSDDTQLMVAALQQVGGDMQVDWGTGTAEIRGAAGRLLPTLDPIFVGNSGTTARFLLPALAACGQGDYWLDGTARMRERPMGELVRALNAWGIDVQATPPGNLPIRFRARQPQGGLIEIAGDQSSQFLSGLLIASPFAVKASEFVVRGPLVSAPFVEMTRTVMHHFGVPTHRDAQVIRVEPAGYVGATLAIEPDATAASYFFAAAAITRGEITVSGLGQGSCQGDLRFVTLLQQMGCDVVWGERDTTVRGGDTLRGIDCLMGDLSDTVPTLAVVALFAEGPTRIRGVAHNRLKESNRIDDLARELRRVGATIESNADGLVIQPGPLHGAELATYDDHRMAMSLALIGLRIPGITIRDPGCVSKTYPGYFADLAHVVSPGSA